MFLDRVEPVSWDRPFAEPIELPKGKRLVTLRDAALYITKLPKAEHDAEEWQAAMLALLLVAEHDGPTMFARIGVMRALSRHVERVFNLARKDPHWGGGSWRRIDVNSRGAESTGVAYASKLNLVDCAERSRSDVGPTIRSASKDRDLCWVVPRRLPKLFFCDDALADHNPRVVDVVWSKPLPAALCRQRQGQQVGRGHRIHENRRSREDRGRFVLRLRRDIGPWRALYWQNDTRLIGSDREK
jgi:hypothetical protein